MTTGTDLSAAPNTEGRIRVPQPAIADQVAQYISEGYVVLDDVLGETEVAQLRQETVAIARGKYAGSHIDPAPDPMSDDEALGRILCLHYPAAVCPVVEQYVKHPVICGLLSQLVGAHIPHWDGSVKSLASSLFIKPSGFPGQAWHQDEVYYSSRDRSITGVWVAIDDATVQNGCIHVIPRSHRSGYLYSQRDHDRADEWDEAREAYGFRDDDIVPVEVKAGSVLVFNGYLLHCSFRNRTTGYRRSLVSHYMNAYSLLTYRFSEDANSTPADDRRIELVAGVDPYRWKGTQDSSQRVFLRSRQAPGLEPSS